MATAYFCNPVTGDDANPGTYALPKRSFSGMKAVMGAGDLGLYAGGIYSGTDNRVINWNGGSQANQVHMPDGSGPVIVDFEQAAVTEWYWASRYGCKFIGIQFRNMQAGKYAIYAQHTSSDNTGVFDCAFYQKAGSAETGRGTFDGIVENCSFHNLEIGAANRGGGEDPVIQNCYYKDCTTPIGSGCVHDWNAYPGNGEANGIDTDDPNSDPGFVDAAADDFRLDDSDSVALALFRGAGIDGGLIGFMGTPRWFYDARFPQTRMITRDPTGYTLEPPLFENDTTYTDPGGAGYTGDIIQDPSDNELVIDLASNPIARSGRCFSDVYDQGQTPRQMDTVMLGAFEDGSLGALIDTDTSLPALIEYRSSNTSFAKGDGTPSWNTMARGSELNDGNRYWQLRLTLHTDHTNT